MAKGNKKTKLKGVAQATSSDSETETESTTPIPLTEAIFKEQLNDMEKRLGAAISALQDDLKTANDTADRANKRADENQKLIEKLQSENAALKLKVNNIELKLPEIEEAIEDRTNRQLRKTIIFRGIPETDKETWEQSENKLSQSIAEICEYDIDEAHNMIERCHRGKANPRYKGNQPRPIICAFANWKDSELVKNKFLKNSISNNNNSTVYADQKFGPLTTARRSNALKLRKELKAAGTIASGFVAFPAKLMVKVTHDKNERYVMRRDFSKDEVKFRV